MFWLCVKRQWLETEHSATKINLLNAQWSCHKHGLPSLPKLNLIWSGAGRNMGRKEESYPNEKKKKIKKEHIYTRWQKVLRGLPSNSAGCLCTWRNTFWISMKAKPLTPSSPTWQVGYHFPRLKVAICFHWKWVTGSHHRDAAVWQGPVLAWQGQGSCGRMGTDEGQRCLMPLLSMELALAILELPGSWTGGLGTPPHPCEGRESCVPAPMQCCVVRAEAL